MPGVSRTLTNDFSWSKSRHEKHAECLRAYYFHYYASWGGWDSGANAEVRELYLLKKLGNRYTWAGSIVHDTLREALLCIQAGKPPKGEALVERAHKQMQRDFNFSKSGGYRRERYRKEFGGLVEHEYQEPVTNDEWKANWETAKAALTWFFASRWVELARALEPKQWLEVDVMDFERSVFHLDGVKVFAVPDFAYYDADGVPVVVDWKTGKPRDGYDDQVLGYALYLASRYRLPVEKVRAVLVYLNAGQEKTVGVDPAALEGFKRRFAESVGAMRALLADPAANRPREEDAFPLTDDLAACARCAFRRRCGREGAEADSANPEPVERSRLRST